jgi:ABC-type branched-subunit amino acid transport system substrate-binding protein
MSPMNTSRAVHDAARRSIASILLTSVAITANHLYSLGPRAFGLGLFVAGGSIALLLWFRATRSQVALAGYALMNLWIVAGFGLFKGLWGGVLRLFVGSALAAISTSFPKPTIGAYGFEATAILMFIGSLFVASSAFEFFHAVLKPTATKVTTSPRAIGIAIAATAGLVAAYVAVDRDTFVPPSNGVVTIGVIAPVTGPYAILGNSFVKAVQMAQADLRGTNYRYEIRIEDSGPDPAKAREHVRKVIEDEKVDAVVGAVSLIGQVTKPFATRARIPHTCVCTVTPIGDGAYNFTNIPSPEAEAIRWVAEAQRRGIASVAIIQQDYPSINNHVKAMKAEALRRGLHLTYANRFADTTKDFRSIIAQARASNPAVFYVEALEPNLDALGQQLIDANVRNIASVVAPSLSEKPWLFEGAWYTDSDLADMAFKRRFEAKYPGTQFATHMMPYAYDSFNMIVRAYEQGVNPAVYIRNIRSYVGAVGTVRKRPGSGNFESEPTVWTITNGKPTLLRDLTIAARTRETTP